MAQRPRLKQLANRRYQCDDIPALHAWLESQEYTFYGQHASDEYGRFSHQEARARAGEKSYSNGYIQVLSNGEIYSPDPHAWQLLDALVEDEVRERSA
jgi:hypothetical protein